MFRVTMCCCRKRSFADWLAEKDARGWSLEEAAEATGCGECCGMCRPYLAVVVETGIVSLPVMEPEEMAEFAARRRR